MARTSAPLGRQAPLRQIRAHLASAQKSNRGAPGYARWVNRPIGRTLAAVAYKTGLTPNQVTAISAGFTMTGILCIALLPPSFGAGLLITVLLCVGFALDAADGQLARLRGGGSPAGEWLDHVVDSVKCSSLHLAVLVSWYRFFDLSAPVLLLIPVLFAIEAAVFYFSIMLTEQLRRVHGAPKTDSGSASAEPAPVLRSLVVLPADYGLQCLTFLLLGWQTAFIWAYGLLLAANVAFLLGAWVNWYRQVAAFGRPPASASA